MALSSCISQEPAHGKAGHFVGQQIILLGESRQRVVGLGEGWEVLHRLCELEACGGGWKVCYEVRYADSGEPRGDVWLKHARTVFIVGKEQRGVKVRGRYRKHRLLRFI